MQLESKKILDLQQIEMGMQGNQWSMMERIEDHNYN